LFEKKYEEIKRENFSFLGENLETPEKIYGGTSQILWKILFNIF